MSIAVQWVVFAELSTDAMIATGMRDDPSAARWIVETIMADVRNADGPRCSGCRCRARLRPRLSSRPGHRQVRYGSAGEPAMTGSRGCRCSAPTPDTAEQRQPWDLREAAQAASPAGPVSFPG